MKPANLSSTSESVLNSQLHFFDAHCHLQEPEILWDIEAILQRWQANGGKQIVCCGTKESDWQMVANIAKKYQEVIPCFGVHPWFVDGASQKWFYELDKYLDMQFNGKVAYIGEIGVDHLIKNVNKEEQERIFKAQLGMAKERNIPVSIHVRKGWDLLIKILKQVGKLNRGGLIHSYSGSADLAALLEKYGLYISFSGSVTHSNNKKVQKSLKAVSKDRLLIETDSPAILPIFQGSCIGSKEIFQMGWNEPCNIVAVASAISQTLDMPLSEVAKLTSDNAQTLFF
ncbi:MAG: TatD family hydrolase [Desulfamplus sp.]|nr:TatD family hydrolase [Desulfamplus sp.]